jgi:hypothetical protein
LYDLMFVFGAASPFDNTSDLIRFPQPVRDRRFHLIPVGDPDDMYELGFRNPVDAPHLTRLDRAAEEHTDFQEPFPRTHEEVAGLSCEHDRVTGGVDPLLAKTGGRLAEALPRLPQILRQIPSQRRLGRCPAIVRLSPFDPLFAVVALPAGHK